MQAQLEIITNIKEIQKAEDGGYPIPEEEIGYEPFFFVISEVSKFRIVGKSKIVLYFFDNIEEWHIKYDETLVKQLVNFLHYKETGVLSNYLSFTQ